MIQNESDLSQLSKKDRRLFFKELAKQGQTNKKRKFQIKTLTFSLFLIILISGLGYLWLTTKPSTQNSTAASGLAQTSSLKLGSQAPNFSLPSADGRVVSLEDYQGKNVLLYFQEGLMCQPCWKQIGTLETDLDAFAKIDTKVVAVGVDSASDWKPILQAENVKKIPVLIDSERKMSTDYGVLSMKSQMHPDRPGHTFVLVNKGGKIAWIADYPTMRVSNEEIINSVAEALKKQT